MGGRLRVENGGASKALGRGREVQDSRERGSRARTKIKTSISQSSRPYSSLNPGPDQRLTRPFLLDIIQDQILQRVEALEDTDNCINSKSTRGGSARIPPLILPDIVGLCRHVEPGLSEVVYMKMWRARE